MYQVSLSSARDNAGFSSKEAAKSIGVYQQTILKYEKDSSDIPLSLLNDLCHLYQIPKDQIFLGKKYDLIHTLELQRKQTS